MPTERFDPLRIAESIEPIVSDVGAASTPGTKMERGQSPILWAAIGTVLGLALLYAATRQVDAAALLTILGSIQWEWVLVILIATISFIAIKAWRWGMLLRFVSGLKFRDLHVAVYVGLAVNFLITHAGEILRTALIARHHRVAASAVLASVVVERALDFIALLLMLALALTIAPELPAFVTVAGAITAAVVVVSVASLYLLLHPPAWLEQLSEIVSRPLPPRLNDWLMQQLERSRNGLVAIKDLRLMSLAIAISVAQWLLVVVAVCCSGFAVGQSVSPVAATVTFVLIVVGLTLPNSPMQIGVTQLAFVIGLGTDGTEATTAIAASLVYTLFLIVPIMVVGGVMFVRGRLVTMLRLR